MTGIQIPAEIADDLIELLFEDGTPSSRDSMAIPTYRPQLIDALWRYCNQSVTAKPPEATIFVDRDDQVAPEHTELFSELTQVKGQFLNPEFDFDSKFDYILCIDEPINLANLEGEEFKHYAANYVSLSVDSEVPYPAALYFEQALRHLSTDGRAVLFTDPSFRSDGGLRTFRDQLYYQIDSIRRYDSEEMQGISTSRAATLITHENHDAGQIGYSYNPERFEAMLGQRVDNSRPFEVAAMMTEKPRGYGLDEPVSKTYINLHYLDFDAALVFEDPDQRSGLTGFISRQQLRSAPGDRLRHQATELSSEYLIDPDASLADLINRLGSHRFVFVGERNDVRGIVTRFDLNRLPMFLHLFDCFSELEIGLRSLIRKELSDWEEQSDVHVRRRGSLELHRDRLSMAKLSTLVKIVRECDIEQLVRRDIAGYRVTLDNVVNLRNAVAHYNPIVHTMGGGSTLDTEVRNAAQLQKEYQFLNDCIAGLR